MSALLARWHRARSAGEAGFTLVEMIISMMIFGVMLTMLSSVILSTKKSSDTVRTVNDLNAQARQALDRISRELRQAKSIDSVSSPDGSTSVTFSVDFNGNGVIDANAADPEQLTYTWQNNNIYLSAANTSGTTVTQPILSGNVTAFSLQYFSSDYRFDCNGDGVTTWQELDHGACRPAGTLVGNNNSVLDSGELPYIDSIVLTFSVLSGSKQQTYRTQIDLRNAR